MTWLLAAEAAEGAKEPNVLEVPTGEFILGTVAFLIVMLLLGKLALPKIKTVLEEREAAIEGGLRRAAAAEAESAKLREQYTDQLAAAREEAAQIRTAALAERAQIIDEARREAQDAQASVVASAQAQIEAERNKASAELRKSVGSVAVDLAGRIIGETLEDDARARAVVDRFITDLEQTTASAVGTPGATGVTG